MRSIYIGDLHWLDKKNVKITKVCPMIRAVMKQKALTTIVVFYACWSSADSPVTVTYCAVEPSDAPWKLLFLITEPEMYQSVGRV